MSLGEGQEWCEKCKGWWSGSHWCPGNAPPAYGFDLLRSAEYDGPEPMIDGGLDPTIEIVQPECPHEGSVRTEYGEPVGSGENRHLRRRWLCNDCGEVVGIG